MFLWLEFNERASQQKESKFSPWYARLAMLLLALTFSFTIGYSRLFLGAHAWNQTLFGWQLGVWLAFSFFFCYRSWVLYSMNRLRKGKSRSVQKFYLWGLGLFTATMTLEIVNYIIVTKNGFAIPDYWITNITTQCPDKSLDDAFANLSNV